jgi:hypothetical protein
MPGWSFRNLIGLTRRSVQSLRTEITLTGRSSGDIRAQIHHLPADLGLATILNVTVRILVGGLTSWLTGKAVEVEDHVKS